MVSKFTNKRNLFYKLLFLIEIISNQKGRFFG
nr:MAG TPA: hypothetical protein [Caudoviricetes sp.]DAM68412.1 MAG TPA: hypothetical protein [Caudoviricetes sp.]DAR63895.1 MAG TPA: hypothetical protein [Caudoviricetes sp.]